MSTIQHILRSDETVEIKAYARNGNKVYSLLGQTGYIYESVEQPSTPHFTTNMYVTALPRFEVSDFDGMDIIVIGRGTVVGAEFKVAATGMDAYVYVRMDDD